MNWPVATNRVTRGSDPKLAKNGCYMLLYVAICCYHMLPWHINTKALRRHVESLSEPLGRVWGVWVLILLGDTKELQFCSYWHSNSVLPSAPKVLPKVLSGEDMEDFFGDFKIRDCEMSKTEHPKPGWSEWSCTTSGPFISFVSISTASGIS